MGLVLAAFKEDDMRLSRLSEIECNNHGFLVPGGMIPGRTVPRTVGIFIPEFPYPCLGGAVGMVAKVGSTLLMFSRIWFNDGRELLFEPCQRIL